MSEHFSSHEWLTFAQVCELLEVTKNKLRRLLEDRYLLAAQIDGEPRIPADFFKNGEPLPGLRGTLTLLADMGLEGEAAMNWMLSEDSALGEAPVSALQRGHKTSVRKSAQLLAC